MSTWNRPETGAGRASAREEFAAAVTEHSHGMFRAARSILDSDADAEDAVGEAVLRAWQSWDRLRARGSGPRLAAEDCGQLRL